MSPGIFLKNTRDYPRNIGKTVFFAEKAVYRDLIGSHEKGWICSASPGNLPGEGQTGESRFVGLFEAKR